MIQLKLTSLKIYPTMLIEYKDGDKLLKILVFYLVVFIINILKIR